MSAQTAVMAGRAAAERRMISLVAVYRKTGETVTANRMEVPEWVTVHTDLPFRLAGFGSDGGSRTVSIGGATYQEATGIAHLPAETTDLADDDLIEVTEGEWPGAIYRIVEAVRKDQATARRVPVVEVSRPVEWA